MIDQETRRRFDEMLPWYVNGTLDADGRSWLEQTLEKHPELGDETKWMESLQKRMREAAPEVSAELGFDRLMARIRHERETTPAPRAASSAVQSWMSVVREVFERLRITPAMATAAAVVLVQFGVIGALLNQQGELESEFERFRSVTGGEIVTGPALEVVFKSDAMERDIREALVRVGGTLAGGPGQLGVYLVYVPAEEIEQAGAALRENPIVELVTVSERAPIGQGS